jgi:hypothetical protein
MSDEPTPGLRAAQRASRPDRGYAAGEVVSLSPLYGNPMRGMALPRSLWSSTKVGTLEIQQLLPKRGRGPREALVWGWPTPIRMNARTELPPLSRHPVYGPAAREEARRIMREAKREKINFGWPTKMNLCRVAKGERPLSFALCKQVRECLARKRAEREVIRQPLEPPTTLPPSWSGPKP